MKKKLLALIFLLFIFGCKKSGNTKKEEEQLLKRCVIERITSKGSYGGDNNVNFTYDDKGRVVKQTSSGINYAGNLVQYNSTYEYLEKRINLYYEYIESGRIHPSSFYYELDGKGRIIKLVEADGSVDETYTYDNNGYFITSTGLDFIYENGNLIRTNSPNGSIDNTYTSDLLLQSEFDVVKLELYDDDYYALHRYFGKASKNLIKTRVGLFGKTTYSFNKDEKGNITRMVKTTGTAPNISTEITDYTYKCF